MPRLESDLEKQVVEWVSKRGGRCLKVKLENQRGFMDRTIWLPEGFNCWVELKIPGGNGKISPHQKLWMVRALKLGQKAFFCDDFEHFKQVMKLWGIE